MNNKKEGEYYSQMVRRFRNEYGGENLQDFCIKEKVSYTKMLQRDIYQLYRRMPILFGLWVSDADILPKKSLYKFG